MKKLSYIIKSSHFIYNVYFYVMSALLRLFGLLLKTDDRLILFNSYGGKKFDDSPKSVYEEMKKDDRFRKYKMVWAFLEPEQVSVTDGTKVVKADTAKLF